ncbi:carbohydrate sulfotransferase 15-like [Lytechinus pictus]|uniref:carbohydrate sulfotransferase 15-like n=1 Tax=Lytechinus pictus TaxID=7653 RepID=UPI0030B9CBA7
MANGMKSLTADGSPTTLYEFDNWRTFFGDRYDGPICTTADLLYAVQPKTKLVITLRDPVDRLYSHYLHFHYKHGSAQQFHAGVLSEIAKYESCRRYHSARACAYGHNTNDFVTLHVGLYSVFIRDWLKVYPGEQLLIYRLDEWIENCPKVFSEVLKFVELDSLPEETVREICAREMANSGANKKKMVGPMMDQTRRLLVDFYAESNRELSKLLGDDRYLWKR